MKKVLSAILVFCLIAIPLTGLAETDETVGYSAIYTADNPVPEIAERIRPAVVEVRCITKIWDPETNIVSTVDQGSGSGVYIDERGYIVTNYHVVENGDELEVITLDGLTLEAELIGYDDGTDIAIIQIDPTLLDAVPVVLGDSDVLKIGELAIAIGNPGTSDVQLFGTVTVGIISGLQREGVNADNFSHAIRVIQTDAAINFGNSGGALLNAKGELIGIPTLKLTGGLDMVFESLGFAIPINTIKPIIEAIITDGKYVRPRFGVTVVDNLGPDEAIKNAMPAGVKIAEIEPGSPAANAHLQINDVITHINGTRVNNYSELSAIIDTFAAGDEITLTLSRYYDESGEALKKPIAVEATVTLSLLD